MPEDTSEEKDALAKEFTAAADFPDSFDSEEDTVVKPSGGLKFITVVMLLLAVSLFVLPFVWGLKDVKTVAPDPSVLDASDWLWWLGDMHVLVIHLPIGVFLWAFTLEVAGLLSFRKYKPHLGATLFFSSVTAILAAVLGYFYFLRGGYGNAELRWAMEGNNIGMHMWLSIFFALFATLSFLSKMWSRHHGKWSPFYPIFMLLTASSMGLSSYMGGKLVHPNKDVEGDFMKLIAGEPLSVDPAQIASVTDIPAGERLVYAEVVKPILQNKCWECHADAELNPTGKKKIEGDLLMTSVADLLKGGKNGKDFPTLIPGNSEESDLLVRTNLDLDDDEFMPKGAEDQPEKHFTDGEKKILAWWIDTAPLIDEENDKPLAEVPNHEVILAEVEAYKPIEMTFAPEKEEETEENKESTEEKEEKEEPEIPSVETPSLTPATPATPIAPIEENIETFIVEPVEEVVEEAIVPEIESIEMPEVQPLEEAPEVEAPADVVEEMQEEEPVEEVESVTDTPEKVEETAPEVVNAEKPEGELVKKAEEETKEAPADEATEEMPEETGEGVPEVSEEKSVEAEGDEPVEESGEAESEAKDDFEERAKAALQEIRRLKGN